MKWLADPAEEPEPFGDGGTKMAEYIQCCIHLSNGNPVMSDVNQRWVGDCCALCGDCFDGIPLSRFVKHIIKDNMDKTYTVTIRIERKTNISWCRWRLFYR